MSENASSLRWLKRLGLVLALILVVLVAGVVGVAMTAGGSTSGTLANGRAVTTFSDAWYLETMYAGDTVTVKTAGYLIVVAPEMVTVNGTQIAKLSATDKNISIKVDDGTITVSNNGKTLGAYSR